MGTTGSARQRFRSALVVFEVAVSLMLLVGAGLLVKSFTRLRETDVGFEPENLITMQISRKGAADNVQALEFLHRVQERIRALPGVQEAAYSNGVPLIGASEGGFAIEGRPLPPPGEHSETVRYFTSASYLQTVGTRLLKGRFFDEHDTQNSPMVVVIDEAFAREQFPNEDPIGKFLMGDRENNIPHQEIVGVVSHVKNYALDHAGPVQPELYYCLDQIPPNVIGQVAGNVTLIVRTPNDPAALVSAIRREVRQEDKNQPLFNVKTMNRVISESISTQQLSMTLIGLFALLALILSMVGIYGVMSYAVAQRVQEIGIRMALGARVRDVLKMVVSQGMLLVLAGIIAGIAGALVMTRLMSSLLFGISPTDVMTFVEMSLILAGVAFIACLAPARRATKVDPMAALRDQ